MSDIFCPPPPPCPPPPHPPPPRLGAGINPVGTSIDFADWYLSSDLNKRNDGQIKALSKPGKDEVRLSFRSRYAAPWHIQLQACMVKAMKSYWRSPNYNFTRMVG